jgi:hypothetical protein
MSSSNSSTNVATTKTKDVTLATVRAETNIRIIAIFDFFASLALLATVLWITNPRDTWYLLQVPHLATFITAFFVSFSTERTGFFFGSLFFAFVLILDLVGFALNIYWIYDCIWVQVNSKCMKYFLSYILGAILVGVLFVFDAVYTLMCVQIMSTYGRSEEGGGRIIKKIL